MTSSFASNSLKTGSVLGMEADLPLRDRSTAAMLLSVAFHVVLLTTLGILWSRPTSGTGAEANRPVGIAMAHQMADRERYIDSKDLQTAEQQHDRPADSSDNAAAAAAPPANLTTAIDLASVLGMMNATPSPVSSTGLAGEMSLDADAFESKHPPGTDSDSGSTSTTLFGVTGTGSRFVYVFDRSDSMNGHGGSPLRAAKRELINSLKSLTERQQFQLIFYNQKPTPYQPGGMPLQLIRGEELALARVERYVDSIIAFGGTEHDGALKMALRMGPDVIFFLTDGRIPRLSGSQLAEIRRRAERSGTTIHAIEFGAEPIAPAETFLRQLAISNNGTYQYVDVRSLESTLSQSVAPAEE